MKGLKPAEEASIVPHLEQGTRLDGSSAFSGMAGSIPTLGLIFQAEVQRRKLSATGPGSTLVYMDTTCGEG